MTDRLRPFPPRDTLRKMSFWHARHESPEAPERWMDERFRLDEDCGCPWEHADPEGRFSYYTSETVLSERLYGRPDENPVPHSMCRVCAHYQLTRHSDVLIYRALLVEAGWDPES